MGFVNFKKWMCNTGKLILQKLPHGRINQNIVVSMDIDSQQILTPSRLIEILLNDVDMQSDLKIKTIGLLGLSAVTGKYSAKIDDILIDLTKNQDKKISLVAERTLIQRTYMYEELLRKTNHLLDKNIDTLFNYLSGKMISSDIAVVKLLIKIGSAKVISKSKAKLARKHLGYALEIADILISLDIKNPEIVPLLDTSFNNEDFRVKTYALKLLSKISTKEVIPYLVAALNDKHTDVKIYALNLSGEIRTPEVIPQLLTMLDNENINIRIQVLKSLGKIGTPEVIPYLVAALNDKNVNIKMEALFSLGEIGTPGVIPYLVAVSNNDENVNLRIQALDSLIKIGSIEVVSNIYTILENNKENCIKIRVLDLLSKIGTPEVIPYIVTALDDKDTAVRIQALDSLGRIGTPDLIPRIITALDDKDTAVRVHALYALGKIDTPEVITHIVTALNDGKNVVVKEMVLGSLSELGLPGTIPSYVGNAIKNFYNIGTPEAVYNMFEAFNKHMNSQIDGLEHFICMRDTTENNKQKICMSLAQMNAKSPVKMIDSYVINKIIDLNRNNDKHSMLGYK